MTTRVEPPVPSAPPRWRERPLFSVPGPVFERLDYPAFWPRVERARGRFTVTRSAMVFPSLKWTWRTIYHNPIAFLRICAISLASLLRRKASRPARSDKDYGVIHSAWTAGYYHWITEALPRAYLLRRQYPEATPLLPSPKYRGYVDSLRLLGFEDVEFFPDNANVRLEDPIITECAPRFATTAPELLREVREALLRAANPKPATERSVVYVSRSKARGRFILNEDEVIEALAPFSPKVVCFEDYAFREQVELMNSASCLISIHGAALTNMLFMPSDAAVFEIIPFRHLIVDYNTSRASFRHDASYIRLAHALGLAYDFMQCDTGTGPWRNTHMCDIRVDTAQMAAALGRLLARDGARRP